MASRAAVMGQRPMYVGRDNIISAFETLRNGKPYYSLWYGRDLFFQFAENDLDKGLKMLDQLLAAAEMNDNTDILTIKFHPKPDKDGFITNKSDVIGTIPVRVVDFDEVANISGIEPDSSGRLAPPVYHMLRGISDLVKTNQDNNALMMEKFITMQQPVEPVAVEPEKDWFDRISGILEKPGVVELIGKVFESLPFNLPAQANLRVSGIEDQPKKEQPVNSISSTAEKRDNRSEPIPADIAEKSDVGQNGLSPGLIAENSDAAAGETVLNHLSDDDYNTVCDSLDTLAKHCDLVVSLNKLAAFADSNPEMFKQVLTNFIK